MRPIGVGLDLVAVARVERMLERRGARLLRRVLTEEERAYCERQAVPARHVAARLAAKEAAYKALAHPEDAPMIRWRDIEVVREITGRPGLKLRGRTAERARRLGVETLLVSLTHTEDHAAAVVLAYHG